MKKATLSTVLLMLLFCAAFQNSCTKEFDANGLQSQKLDLPAEPYAYNHQDLPNYAPPFLIDINNDVATLGRVLFYDKVLSANNSVACASCHLQSKAFSDGLAFSKGFTGKSTTRSSMAIINPGSSNGFFWDLREHDLKSMVTKPVQNHIEMGFDSLGRIVSKVENLAYYKPLFKNAYGSEDVSIDRVQEALLEFLTSMTTYKAKYDEGMNNNFANFTAQELLGKKLFTETLHCNNCHNQPSFSSPWGGAANIGLEEVYKDAGMGYGQFKIPSLRNIALTAPYMHDGRFKTLSEVIEHYNSGVKENPYLDWSLRDNKQGEPNGPRRLNLSQVDKEALIAFLYTLTDQKFITDKKYSNPFRN
jgi:cytochrome c peroxidase